MPGIFKIDKKTKSIIPTRDALSLCPELNYLSDKEFEYIIIVYDYVFSPWYRRPKNERKDIALKKLFGEKTVHIEQREAVKVGIEAYKSIIYDERRETIDACKTKIQILNDKLTDPAILKSKELADLDASINILQKRIDKNQEELDTEEEKIDIIGNRKLSWIEKMKRSKRLYEIKNRL